MRFEDLNWMDVERYLQDESRVMVVIGSCEQHAYLSLATDVQIPLALADAASELTGVLVAPTINLGSSPYFVDYPGTISLRISTLLDLVEDVVRSLHHQGFRRFLFLNGHGGNTTARARLYEIATEFPEVRFAWYEWWNSHSVEQVARKYSLKPAHANWLEAFPFTLVAELPDKAKVPPRIPGLMGAVEARQVYGDGSFGGEYKVENAIMDEIFGEALEDVLELLKSV
jgi:creatinine amidohydrolase